MAFLLVLIPVPGATPNSPFPDLPHYGGLRPYDLPETAAILAEPGWEQRLAPTSRPGSVSGHEAIPASEEAEQRRRRVVDQIREVHANHDVLLTPTIDQIAPLIPDDWSYPYAPREAGAGEASLRPVGGRHDGDGGAHELLSMRPEQS